MLRNKVAAVSIAALLAGCGGYTAKPESFILPTSHTSIDVVLHRSDVRLMDCATLAVIQTYDSTARLIDSKEARGTALHCTVLPALIEAGGRVGAASVVRPARTTISNAVSSTAGAAASQVQGQGQVQGQKQGQLQGQSSTNVNVNSATGGAGGEGGQGGQGGHGNNGGGNGDDDGTNPGSNDHHDNGDND